MAIAGRLELVADGLSFPTSLTFDPMGVAYVAEAGLPFGGAPAGGRVWQLQPRGNRRLLADGLAPPVNGLTFYDGGLYVSEAGPPGRISRLELDGRRVVIVGDLPGPGNYHTNMVAFGPDGRLYFSQGAMTNTGIIGLDAYELGWLRRLPHAHDLPGHDLILVGINVETPDPLSDRPDARASTGAFVPFGTSTEPGQHIPARLPCTAAMMRCNPDGTDLELVPFLAVRGKTPLVLWFSRITEVCYCDAAGERRCEGGAETALYNELNIIALLRQRALFVPGIYATDERTIRIGHRYGMPKQPASMQVRVDATHFEARMMDGACESFVRARLLGAGRGVAQMVSRLWSRQLWPARFPIGTDARATIQATPWVRVAHVRQGQLCLDTPWLPQEVSLLPVGLYLPHLGMRLPP